MLCGPSDEGRDPQSVESSQIFARVAPTKDPKTLKVVVKVMKVSFHYLICKPGYGYANILYM